MIQRLNFLPWVAAPMLIVVWAEITFPLWKNLPPILLILLALGILAITSLVATPHLPRTFPGLAYRATHFAVGFTFAVWRYFDA